MNAPVGTGKMVQWREGDGDLVLGELKNFEHFHDGFLDFTLHLLISKRCDTIQAQN